VLNFAKKKGKKIYATNSEGSLVCLKLDSLIVVSQIEKKLDSDIRYIVHISEKQAILRTRNKTFLYDFNNHQQTMLPNSTSKYITGNRLYCGLRLSNSRLALGTLEGGLVIVDNDWNIINIYNIVNGLKSQTVHAINKDLYGNIWLSLGDGITQLKYNSPITYFNKNSGLNGIAEDIISVDNKVYVGTTTGVFSSQENFTFKQIENSKGECWKLQEFNKDIICCSKNGFFTLKDEKLTPIFKEKNSWTFIELKNNRNVNSEMEHLISGSNSGLSLVVKNIKGWKLQHHIKGFDQMCRWVQEDPQGNIWVSEEYKGVYKLTLNSKLDSVIKIKHFDIKSGLPSTEYNYLFKIPHGQYAKKLVLGTNTGLFEIDTKNDTIKPFKELNKYIDANDWTYGITSDNENNIYLQNGNKLFALEYKKDNHYIPVSKPFNKFSKKMVESITSISKTEIAFATKDGITIYNPYYKNNFETSYPTYIREISIADSIVYQGAGELETQVINYHENKVRILFSAAYYQNSEKLKYSYKLEGFNEKWSDWSEKTEQEFTNMLEGNYTFSVKAINIYGEESQIDTFTFVIKPPWYRTVFAYVIYGLFLVLFIIVCIRLYTRKLLREKAKLETTIKERTFEISKQNGELKSIIEVVNQQKEELLTQAENLESSHKEISIANDNTKKLSEIGKLITASLKTSEIVSRVYNSINTLMPATVFTIGIYNDKSQKLEFIGGKENNESLPDYSYDLGNINRPAVWCFKNKKVFFVNDFEKEYVEYFPENQEVVVGEDPRGVIYVPLLQNDKILGVMSVQAFEQNAYTEKDVSVLKNIAVYISIALENANSLNKTEQQRIELNKQKEELAVSNRELSKLSIVAEKTNNIVVICNPEGEFLWANTAYERVYETSFNERLLKGNKNLFTLLSPRLSKKIKEHIAEKKINNI